jgi:hypothetical protein
LVVDGHEEGGFGEVSQRVRRRHTGDDQGLTPLTQFLPHRIVFLYLCDGLVRILRGPVDRFRHLTEPRTSPA